jgi:hypothetical protein
MLRSTRGAAALGVTLALISVPFPGAALAADPTPADCRNPDVPSGFRKHLVTAIRVSGNLPMSWADAKNIRRIICWQQTDFSSDFRAAGYQQRWIGIFAMTRREVRTIRGPWLSNDPNELILDPDCFVHGWRACPHRTANSKSAHQLIAGLRWIWLLYGDPSRAWQHIRETGRFNSYPRPGTDGTPTREPFRLCPVRPPVSYKDDFGEARLVGGYHPHGGNDIGAPIGRPIRAPFAGLVTAHADGWFAGRYVRLVGAEGYVGNAHLARIGKRGWVKAGTVIGYVGTTGDARTPHDHFEWHPWNVPHVLHRSPLGFTRVADGIDPYPFLNQVCQRSQTPRATRGE